MSNQMWKHFAEDGDMEKNRNRIFFSDFRFFRKNYKSFYEKLREKVEKKWKNSTNLFPPSTNLFPPKVEKDLLKVFPQAYLHLPLFST